MRIPYSREICWIVNDMPAALGERGVSIDPSGSCGRTLADNWEFIERLHRSIPDVRRARRLMKVWSRLDHRHQHVLCAFYSARQEIPTLGAKAAFGEFATVALLVAEDRHALIGALSNGTNAKHVPIISAARTTAINAVKLAHEDWYLLYGDREKNWATGGDL